MLQLHTPSEAAQWLRTRVTGTLQTDSRKLQPGDGFFAWPGAAHDARRHVTAALQQGALACLVEHQGSESLAFDDARIASYAGLKAASGLIGAAYFDQPTQQLALLAVTGTNGKTSTAWWLAQALSNLQQVPAIPCAMIGTLGVGRVANALGASALDGLLGTGLTTPEAVQLQGIFRQFVAQGIQACAIEASSTGIEEHRLDGCQIHSAIFTNLTQDHLDYHGSMAAYWKAKASLFAWPGLRSAIVNIDDEQGMALAESLRDRELDLWTLSFSRVARLQALDIQYDAQGLNFRVQERNQDASVTEPLLLRTQLIGTYNVSNLLGVLAAMRSLGVPLSAAVAACHHLSPVPGRMECVTEAGKPLAAVDYAHTPDALGKALVALRSLAQQRGGQLWCVFGCGGDRDSAKRPLMGAMAARYADQVVVTSDNPRSEKPDSIISQILLGLTGHQALTVQPDRALAIHEAVQLAQAKDVLLIAGKGHEDYQEVAGQRLPFSDLQQVRLALDARRLAVAQKGGRA